MAKKTLSKAYEPQISEGKWYQYWVDHDFFHAEDKSDKKPFSIVIPPPNVTGILHMGHALNNSLQDITIRAKRMQGYNTLWMPGTDHAGIATQNVVEQELAKEGLTRFDLGREKFVERVWQWRTKYGGVIINQLKRLGSSCDWQRERFTMDEGLSKAVREVFVRLYNANLIYQGDYIVNWCPRCHTAISDLEVEYKEEGGFLWNIRYPYKDGTGEIVVATTRPETMLGDTAVAVNPADARYKDVIGKDVILPLVNRVIPIIADDYVTMEFGSGAVKITPSSDPADFAMAERHNLEIVKIMDGNGAITAAGGVYEGQDRYECRKNVVEDLKAGGYLISVEPYSHNVGKCYRCKTDIEPLVSRQWFVKVQPLAKAATAAVVKGNTKIVPPMWEATYYEWMNNIRDWCISRQLWWGHRIPVWYCEGCGKVIVATHDPDHCPGCNGTKLRQDEDVLDTWFSSALWPFSTMGWPEQTEALKTFYPTSVLITAFDIIFFWVARMMMMGLYIMDDVPFKDVYIHALVRDEKGEKMSKSKGNSIDPLEIIDKFGADAFRFTLAALTAQGRDVRISEERIEGYKFFVNKIWNATKFSLMNLEDYAGGAVQANPSDESLPDRWIKSRLNKVIDDVTKGIDEYRYNDAAMSLYQFIWHELCDWYLELSKPVLYGKETPEKKLAAQHSLFVVLKSSLQLLHPFMPFVTEEIWQTLIDDGSSIMVSAFPKPEAQYEDEAAERQMAIVMEVITKIRNIRAEMGLPLAKKLKVVVSAPDEEMTSLIIACKRYILNLANVEKLAFGEVNEEAKNYATGVVGSIRLFVLLEEADVVGEKARLEKEMAKIDKELAVVSKKLENPSFMEKAAPDVIRKEEEKYRQFKEKYAALEEALKRFGITG
ncbi:MAG: valine--tRNA ligase [Deltaproteobacteria bacterium]|nr:valine--tRNA ligase [Deltaproteobacteria bacterium]